MRKAVGIAGSIALAVATAIAIDYVSSRDEVRDALDDVSGSAPVLVRPFRADSAFVERPWALPDPLPERGDLRTLDQDGIRELLASTDAVPLGVGEVEVTIEGDRADSVIVERIDARVVSRAPAPAGTFISKPAFGGPSPSINLGFNLDSGDKRARVPTQEGTLGEAFGPKQYIEIERDEKLVFVFYGVAKQPYLYRWVVDLTIQVGDQHTVVTVGDDAPYAVSGPVERYERYYNRLEWSLTPATASQACPGGCVQDVNKVGFVG